MDDNVEFEEYKPRRRRKKKMSKKRFWITALVVYVLLMTLVLVFVNSGDKDDLYKAHWKEGKKVITMGGVDYRILSSGDSTTYIGSTVSDRLNGVKKDKIASVRSYMLYVSVFFSLENDPEFDYLLDGKNYIYVKDSMYNEAVKYVEDFSNMSEYRMTSAKKDLESMNTLTKEEVDMLENLTGEEKIITDIKITENYENRREIYGFYDNNILYKARMELFKYNGEIYKTTFFIDKNKNKGTTTLKGIKLPEEYQERFKSIWD